MCARARARAFVCVCVCTRVFVCARVRLCASEWRRPGPRRPVAPPYTFRTLLDNYISHRPGDDKLSMYHARIFIPDRLTHCNFHGLSHRFAERTPPGRRRRYAVSRGNVPRGVSLTFALSLRFFSRTGFAGDAIDIVTI